MKSSQPCSNASPRALHTRSLTHSICRGILHEAYAARGGQGASCRTSTERYLHQALTRSRTWPRHSLTEPRSSRPLNVLPCAQLPSADRGVHGDRAPGRSRCESEHERAVGGQLGIMPRAATHVALRTGWQHKRSLFVDRRPSCDAGTRHDVSTDSSSSCRSARRKQQHVAAVAVAPPGGLLLTWPGRVRFSCPRAWLAVET